MEIKTVNGPGVGGIHPQELIVTAKASEAQTKGDICQFDFHFVAATDDDPGESASPFYLVRDPDAEPAGVASGSETLAASKRCLSGGIFGVALEDIAAAATGKVMLRGIVTANVDGACDKGAMLVPATDGQADLARGGSNYKIIGIGLEADTSNFAKILFDGLTGFGTDCGVNVSS